MDERKENEIINVAFTDSTTNGKSEQKKARKTRSSAKVKRALLKALKMTNGIISPACEACRISRQTFYNWLNSDEKFRAKVDEINETAIDFVECKMFEGIRGGDVRLIQFFLTKKGRSRGYAPELETNGPERVNVVISDDEANY